MGKVLSYLAVLWGIFCAAQAQTIIVDDQDARFSSAAGWTQSTDSPERHAATYRETASVLSATSSVSWTPDLPAPGNYDVAVWFTDGSDRASDARYTLNYSGGSQTHEVDQRTSGGQWVPLGAFAFDAPSTEGVALSNQSSTADKKVIADAVRFVREGTTYQPYQAVWIFCRGTAEWGFYSNEAQTSATLTSVRQQNVNAIFPRIRASGRAYYISATEPRGFNIDPAYPDPLADILSKAHDTSEGKQYIEVHGWIIPYAVWSTNIIDPLPDGHVLTEHPEWVMSDYSGNTADSVGLIWLDPGVPAVEDYIVDVVLEIVQNYDVDGIHFDYIRYPGMSYGYNPVSVARFNQLYGKSGTPHPSDDPEWCDFRREQIKAVVRKAYARVKQLRWGVKMSAATITFGYNNDDFTQSRPYTQVFQDWQGMMSEGMLDLNCPMCYFDETIPEKAADFRSWTQFTAANKAGRHAIIGTQNGANYMHNNGTQMNYARDCPGIDGNIIFCYGDTSYEGPGYEDISWQTIRADTYDQRRNIPEASWLTSPSFGILCGTVRNSATTQVLDGATVTLSGGLTGTEKTDGTGFYGFLKLPPGTGYQATASHSGMESTKPFNIIAGSVTTLDFTLPETHVLDWKAFILK
jgi:uncharacterized lipoprotein YddW (UPF0748 family)